MDSVNATHIVTLLFFTKLFLGILPLLFFLRSAHIVLPKILHTHHKNSRAVASSSIRPPCRCQEMQSSRSPPSRCAIASRTDHLIQRVGTRDDGDKEKGGETEVAPAAGEDERGRKGGGEGMARVGGEEEAGIEIGSA